MNEFGPVLEIEIPELLEDEDDDELLDDDEPPPVPIVEEPPFRSNVVSFAKPDCDLTLNGPKRMTVVSWDLIESKLLFSWGVKTLKCFILI